MADTPIGGPSLLLASHDEAQQEHQHQHYLSHRAESTNLQSIVTEVLATISVIQQPTVGPTGNPVGFNAYTADFTGGTSYPPTTSATSSSSSSTTTASPGTSTPASTSSSNGAGEVPGNNVAPSPPTTQSLISVDSASVATPTSIPTTFASIPAGSNFTSLISTSSTNQSPFFSSSTFSSPTLSTSTFIISSSILSTSSSVLSTSSSVSYSSSGSLFADPSLSSTKSSAGSYSTPPSTSTSSLDPSSTSSLDSSSNSSSSTSSSSPFASYTDGTLVYGTGTASGSSPASTSGAGSDGDSDDSSAPATSTVVGGVIGGLAGLAILIFLFMFLIRWRRRKESMLALGSGEGDAAAGAARSVPPQSAGGMAERSAIGNFSVPAALASLTGYKRSSQSATVSTTGSERGFYRVSGRKLPSVLQSGGDGYGDGITEGNTLSGSSFSRDSQGFYSGPGGTQRDSGVPIMREGPARTPVTEHSPFAAAPDSLNPPPPRRPDAAGRVPSQDGSQRSRFTEEV
ncbi:hypothetical protein JHW43_005059 [Diplocarpon mali]|nr:hypothetical protein JHW43_005059 [Diplocarpon mali]